MFSHPAHRSSEQGGEQIPFTIDRIGRGAFSVPNWSACFLGGIQPGPIQKIAQNSAEDGLLGRFFYAVPGPQTAGLDRAPAPGVIDGYKNLVHALARMRPPAWQGTDKPQVIALHHDAHQHRERVNDMAQAMALLPDTTPRLKAAIDKWPGQFARLALTFHMIDHAHASSVGTIRPYLMVIPEPTARRAAAFMLEIVLPHLLRAHALMFQTEQTGHARWIAGFILARKLDRIATRDVVQAYGALRPPERKRELADVMDSLVTIGWLDPEAPSNPLKPVFSWTVNPAVHVQFAAKAEAERKRRDAEREIIAAHAQARRDSRKG